MSDPAIDYLNYIRRTDPGGPLSRPAPDRLSGTTMTDYLGVHPSWSMTTAFTIGLIVGGVLIALAGWLANPLRIECEEGRVLVVTEVKTGCAPTHGLNLTDIKD